MGKRVLSTTALVLVVIAVLTRSVESRVDNVNITAWKTFEKTENESIAVYLNYGTLLVGIYHIDTYPDVFGDGYHRIKTFVNVTAYRFRSNTWTPAFLGDWDGKNVSSIAIDDIQPALLTNDFFHPIKGVDYGSKNDSKWPQVFFYDYVGSTWKKSTVFSLPNFRTYYGSLRFKSFDFQNGFLIAAARPLDASAYVYIYLFENSYGVWKYLQSFELSSSCIMIDRNFVIYGDQLIVGCPCHPSYKSFRYENYCGSKWGVGPRDVLHVFNITDTSIERKVLPPTETAYSSYGSSISVDRGTLAVGRSNYQSGVVYLYELSGVIWVEKATLKPSNQFSYNNFGCTVLLRHNYLLVGSAGDAENGNNSGAVHIYAYTNGTWREMMKVMSSEGVASPLFGSSVDFDGNHLAVTSANSFYLRDFKELLLTPDDTNVENTTTDRHRPQVDELKCFGGNVTAYWFKSSFDGDNITITTTDSHCKVLVLGRNTTMYWASLEHLSCGSNVIETDHHIVVTSTLLITVYQFSNGLITRDDDYFRFNIKCTYLRDVFVSVHKGYRLGTELTETTYNKSSEGSFVTTMDMYESSLFTEKMDYPVNVTTKEPLFVGVRMDHAAKMKFVVEKCFATPTTDRTAEGYVFFVYKCPFDKTFKMLEYTGEKFYFTMNAFRFLYRKREVFLHCKIRICSKNSTSPSCEQACSNRYRRGVTSSSEDNIQYVSSGRILYAEKKTCKDIVDNCPRNSFCVETFPPACRCVEGYVLSVKTNRCENERVISVKKLRVDKQWEKDFSNRSSPRYLQFAHAMEEKLYRLFVLDLKLQHVIGVKVDAAHKGSVLVDFSLIYSANTSREAVTESLIDKLQDKNTSSLTAFRKLNLKLDKLPTIEVVVVPDEMNYAIIALAAIIPGFLFIVAYIFYSGYKQRKPKEIPKEPLEFNNINFHH